MSSVPERVLSLVEASGLTRREFGQSIGLDESKMSKSLNGARRFSSVDLARVAELCSVTVDWLVTGEETPLAMAARTTGGHAGAALDAAKLYTTLRADIAGFGYPQSWDLPSVDRVAGGYAAHGRALAEAALSHVDKARQTIATDDLIAVVEEVFGVDVAVVELGSGFDGLAASSEHAKIIVLGTSHMPARQRFTLVHELGHLLAEDDQEIHLDRDVYDKDQKKDPSEQRANAFASTFLMPEAPLRDAVGPMGLTEHTFATLACDLMVTPSALAYRLLNLRLIDAGTCDRYKAITTKVAATIAGQGAEFAQLVTRANTPRPPGLLVRDTYAAYESGATTLRPYANLLGTDVDELRDALESEHGTHDA